MRRRRAPRFRCCTSWSRTGACTALWRHPRPRRARRARPRAAQRWRPGHLGAVGTGRSARQRLRPPGDPARLRRGRDGRRRPRVGDRRGGEGDRGGAGREVRRLGLQRARAGPDAARPRGRAAADPLRERVEAPAHDPLPRHPHVDRRTALPGVGRGQHRAGEVHHLRVRRHALRPAPLPLPLDAARRAHRQGSLRRLHHRSQGGAPARPTSS